MFCVLIIAFALLLGLLLLSLHQIRALKAKVEWLKDDLMFLHKIVRFQGWEMHEHLKTNHRKKFDG